MNERVKELNCFYNLSDIVEKYGSSIEKILKKFPQIISSAWQYPDITCAMITYHEKKYETENFKNTRWKQSADIIVNGKNSGKVIVCYLKKKPESFEGPFLREERYLLNACTERLGKIIERQIAEKRIKDYSNNLERIVKDRTNELKKTNMQLKFDIKKRQKAEKEILEIKNFYQNILESIHDGVWVSDRHNIIYYVNQEMGTISGISPELIKGNNVLKDFSKDTLKFFRPKFLEAKKSLQPLYYDSLLVYTPAGHKSYQSGWLIPRIMDNRYNGMICTVTDVTKQITTEQQIITSLKEKELLLEEIHHRVKNNLQIISSIIDMKSMKTRDKKAIDFFEDLKSKIFTISIIHAQIYNSKSFTSVDFEEYVFQLVKYIQQIFSYDTSITVDMDVMPVQLEANQAIPCALALNELLSNSFKHAFKDRDTGRIKISLKKRAKKISLIIKDDGVGFPEDFNSTKTSTLGVKFVKNLVQRQLKGTIKFIHKEGTEVRINIEIT